MPAAYERSAGLDLTRAAEQALERAVHNLAGLQHPDGCVAGEVVWNPMLAAQYAIVAHLTGQHLPAARTAALRRYFERQQGADGGWAMHDDSGSFLYVTTLVYVAMRLMGVGPAESSCVRARAWLDAADVVAIPSWGKLWLAMIGLYDYDGLHPVPPEVWLLPEWMPMHPRRYYCHTRLIYMGFSYLYGVRFRGPETETVRALRAELYPRGWEGIDWPSQRSAVAASDRFVENDPLLEAMYTATGLYERVAPRAVRRRALALVLSRVRFEQRSSRFAGISPVNGMLNTLVLHHAGDEDFDRAFLGIDYWMWEDPEQGLRIAGASSNTWDTAFAAQAIGEGPLAARFADVLARMYRYFDDSQVRRELPDPERWYRLPSLGGWCFGDPHHHWPVSDCTAEALSALAVIEGWVGGEEPIRPGRLQRAVEFILLRQNPNGGFGSYEHQRAGFTRRTAALLERINPAEMFGNCMSEYSYLECTSSCVQALAHVLERWGGAVLPPAQQRDVRAAIERGAAFIARAQGPHGGWPGFWGINYTYGTFFGVSGLLAAGVPRTDRAIRSACRWLVEHRLPDGGWGESYLGCVEGRYVPHERSQVVQTAWAVLTLLRGGDSGADTRDAIDGGVRLLIDRQRAEGGWDEEAGTGIFFNTAVLRYDLYRHVFPLWALSLYTAGQGG